jgi:preprotein translocase subunit SecY
VSALQSSRKKNINRQLSVKSRLILTLQVLLISRLASFVPIQNIDQDAFYLAINSNIATRSLTMFSNGACSVVSLFALGIIPNINASIIIQLLVATVPTLEKLQKEEGEFGRQKIVQYTRYLTFFLAVVESIIGTFFLRNFVFNWNALFIFQTVLCLTTGAMITLWFSELITEKGIGNGTSWFIFINILSGTSQRSLQNINFQDIFNQETNIVISFLVFTFFLVSGIIFVQEARRKIPIISSKQFATPDVNSKNAFIPFRLNQSGIMPLIFASTIISLLLSFNNLLVSKQLFLFVYVVLMFLFSFFYNSIIIDPQDISLKLKKMSSSISGVRPGTKTIKFLDKILKRLTFLGAIFLVIVALVPNILEFLLKTNIFSGFGATSLIIIIGVAIENIKQIQTLLITKQYDQST